MPDSDLVQRVYRQFSPAPLATPDEDDLYVPLDEVRGDRNIVSRLGRTITLAGSDFTCQVLAGHKGSGKSTELNRLKRVLETKANLFVVYVQVGDCVDLYDVEFPEVLIAIIRQLAVDLRKRAEVELKPGYFKDRLERLGRLLTSEVDLKSLELGSGLGKLAVQIKSSPDARAEIRKAFEPDTANWLYAANDVISEATQALVKKGLQGLVLLVDDLDKMDVHAHGGAGCTTDEYLFVNRAAQLTAFHCHAVYTIPLALAYSHNEQTIKNNYGGHVPVVPMTKVATRPPDNKPYPPGVEKFREIIGRRLAKAEAAEKEVFAADDVRDELITLSGGQPTELMTLVREAIIAHGLPIDRESLKRAQIDGQREYARQLHAEHWPILNEIRRRGDFSHTADNDLAFRELLRSRAILQYVNDEEWYALNPMVAALKPPQESQAVK